MGPGGGVLEMIRILIPVVKIHPAGAHILGCFPVRVSYTLPPRPSLPTPARLSSCSCVSSISSPVPGTQPCQPKAGVPARCLCLSAGGASASSIPSSPPLLPPPPESPTRSPCRWDEGEAASPGCGGEDHIACLPSPGVSPSSRRRQGRARPVTGPRAHSPVRLQTLQSSCLGRVGRIK